MSSRQRRSVVFVWIKENRYVLQDYLANQLPKDWKWDEGKKVFFSTDQTPLQFGDETPAGAGVEFRPTKQQPKDPYLTAAIEVFFDQAP